MQQAVGIEGGVGVAEGCPPALILSEKGWSEMGCVGKSPHWEGKLPICSPSYTFPLLSD